MFSKSNITRRLAWLRGKVAAAHTLGEIDVEAELSSRSQGTSTDFLVGFENENEKRGFGTRRRPRTSIDSRSTIESSSSGSFVGPQGDPNNFFVEPETGKIVKRWHSLDNLSEIGGERGAATRPNRNGDFLIKNQSSEGESVHPNGTTTEIKHCSYLTKYIEQMYYFGTSPYKTLKQRKLEGRNWFSWSLRMSQKVMFWFITIMSGIYSLASAKHAYLCFMDGTGLYNFVDFCFYSIEFITKMQAVYNFLFEKEKIDKMIDMIEGYENITCSDVGRRHSNIWVAILGAFTILFVIVKCVFYGGFSEWSPENLILENSHEFAEYAFIWKPMDMNRKSKELEASYGTNLTSNTVLFGLSTLAADLVSHLQMDAIRDLILVAAVTIFCIVSGFIKGVEETMENVSPNDEDAWTASQRKREENWQKYRDLKELLEHTNETFDSLLKVMHVNNLLFFAFYVSLCIKKESIPAIMYLMYACSLTKTELTYYIAGKTAEKNDILRKWIRNWGRNTGTISVGGEILDTNIVLDELEKEPLGFGKGNFLIQESFHFKFLGMVGSLSLFLADDKEKALN